ncbi:MAG: pyridoxal-phosphate dependent enzyme [SAR202 cluster bacterium]|nr:pyridoxal-phosphate dependent enzyme [SAR202 cluster bacterium]
MVQHYLICTRCTNQMASGMNAVGCDRCGGPLDVGYVPDGSSTYYDKRRGMHVPLPISGIESLQAVSMGEGNTPTVQLTAVGGMLGAREIRAKLEYLGPTGSFKDRGTVIMMAMALEAGVKEVVEDSSGNAGASVSAYAARVGIKAHIFAPATAPAAKLRQIKAYGATVHSIEGPREAATAAAVAFYKERGMVYTSHVLSPYFAEGTKVFAYETAEQMRDSIPAHIVFPVGNGSLIIGAWKGFTELQRAGRIARMPKLHCVQARGVMPIVTAATGKQRPAGVSGTVAGGIAVGAPARKEQVVSVVKASQGSIIAVDDADTLRWQKALCEREGIFGEPTSAAGFAGLEALIKRGDIGPAETVLVPVTGFGLKDAIAPG